MTYILIPDKNLPTVLKKLCLFPVLRIRIHMFLGITDPDPLAEVRIRILPYHQAKKVRKTLIPTVFQLLYNFYLSNNDVNVPSKSNTA
jgi:hypothetical protein